MHHCLSCFVSPSLFPPSAFGFSQTTTSVCRLRVLCSPSARSWPCQSARVSSSITPHTKPFCLKPWLTKHEEERRGWQLPEKLVACEPSSVTGGEGCILWTFEEVPTSLPTKPARGSESPFSPCNRCCSVFSKVMYFRNGPRWT
uniref:Uncharacterized protein n=1 Tax=Molossus molossus TaxID=27622 RepID=A0A7J8F9A3_MOLMO|nr:hypothetical protein HJG59_008516 [Molossus molossus]